jgi:general secretion pathway protein G
MLRRRAGFTVVEVVVAAVLVAVLAALLIPAVAGRVRDGQTSALAQSLDALSHAITAYRIDVRRYPTRLQDLTTPPPVGTTEDPCGRVVPAAFLDNWRGPYLPVAVTAAGLRVGDATVQDELTADPGGFGINSVGYLLIEVEGVDEETAISLDDAFDGGDGSEDGGVRWATPSSSGQVTLTYGIRIRGC